MLTGGSYKQWTVEDGITTREYKGILPRKK